MNLKNHEEHKQFLNEFQQFPETKNALKKEIEAKMLKLGKAKFRLKNVESKLMTDIYNHTTNGKATFSSKERREHELERKKWLNKDCIDLEKEIREIEYQISQDKLELELVEDKFKVARSYITFLDVMTK